jgi:Tfp pilus assembly protein PilV
LLILDLILQKRGFMEINQSGMRRKWAGMTLIEVLISSAIFALTFGGMLIGQNIARNNAEKSFMSFVITHHAQGLLEAIQSYAYQDSSYDFPSTAVDAFLEHSRTPSTVRTNSLSGVYENDAATNAAYVTPTVNLDRERFSLGYYATTAGTTARAPFTRNDSFQDNDRLLGFEDGDKHTYADISTGIYKITRKDQMRNIFANFDQQTIGVNNNGTGQEKYFYADDVDDFDGYREIQDILPKVSVTFDISVAGVYDNVPNYSHPLMGATTITQNPYSLMNEAMSVSNFKSKLTTQVNADVDAKTVAFDYYNKMLFKKITVLATWEYPPGSGKNHTIVIDGGKVNPEGDAQ